MWGRHRAALVPVPCSALCLSLLDVAEREEVVSRMRVGSASTSRWGTQLRPRAQKGPKQRARHEEKVHREGWSPPWVWEGAGSSYSNPPTILLVSTYFINIFSGSQFNAVSTTVESWYKKLHLKRITESFVKPFQRYWSLYYSTVFNKDKPYDTFLPEPLDGLAEGFKFYNENSIT